MRRGPGAATLGLAFLLAAAGGCARGESFDASAYEKKPFEWTGFVEARPEAQRLRTDSSGYRLQYPGEQRRSADRLATAAEVSGVVRHGSLGLHFTGHASWLDEPRGSEADGRMYEAYARWQAGTGFQAELGKRALRWGKGYAFSPVAFLERPRDATDPELAREGFAMATGSWVGTFDASLKTLSLTAAVVPTTGGLNADYGPPGHANPALKVYALLHDTDIDVVWATQGSRGARLGVDFSRNFGSNLEVHGEWARLQDFPQQVLTPAGSLARTTATRDAWLLGLRYLTARDTTIIAELYRHGGGYSRAQLADYYDLVRASDASPLLLATASRAAAAGYGRSNAARQYAYLRVSQKEPFDVLDFTPSVTLIVNTGDRSWAAIPELLYTGVRNVELRARLAVNRGDARTEFGERPVRHRLELRARVFF